MVAELLPTGEMVAVAWLKTNVAYLDGLVATSLPNDIEGWKDKGFTVVNSVGGGVANNGKRHTVVSLAFYGVKSESGKAPWNRVGQLAEQIREASDPTNKAYATTRAKYRITNLGSAYKDAKVLEAGLLSEPRRRPGDDGDYAVIVADFELKWVVVNA